MLAIRHLLVTLAGNTLIAIFLTVLGVGAGFAINLLISQCIGLSIFTACSLAARLVGEGPRRFPAIVAAVPVGVVCGLALGLRISGVGWEEWPTVAWQAVVIGVTVGVMGSGFLYLRERNLALLAEVQQREMARLAAEARGIEAQLKMLQAQIEPHFLFNTLANVSSLIAREPVLANTLLEALICYLRASLTRTRADGGTLADELALLQAYLEILKIRMGERLSFVFAVDESLLTLPFPPMLLQPLVENAITHGLECKVDGGTVRIDARREAGRLTVCVVDNGLGVAETPQLASGRGKGLGLSNIRARLDALYGAAASLALASKVGAGTTATISIPLEKTP